MKSIEVTTYRYLLISYIISNIAYSIKFQVFIYAIFLLYELPQQFALVKYYYNSGYFFYQHLPIIFVFSTIFYNIFF